MRLDMRLVVCLVTRLVIRFSLLLLWLICGLIAVTLIFPLIKYQLQRRVIGGWSCYLLKLLGINLKIQNQAQLPHNGPLLLLANHISWVDIFCINTLRPAHFVAKSEIRSWPVLGWLVARAHTVFIQRHSRHAVRHTNQVLNMHFAQAATVAIFPEGGTSNGEQLRPFHSNLLQPAVERAVKVYPLALRYCVNGAVDTRLAYVGEQTFLCNLMRILATRHISVELVVLPEIDLNRLETGLSKPRHRIAMSAQQAIAEYLNFALPFSRTDVPPAQTGSMS